MRSRISSWNRSAWLSNARTPSDARRSSCDGWPTRSKNSRTMWWVLALIYTNFSNTNAPVIPIRAKLPSTRPNRRQLPSHCALLCSILRSISCSSGSRRNLRPPRPSWRRPRTSCPHGSSRRTLIPANA